MTTVRAKFDGQVLVPMEPVNLRTGEVFEVDIRSSGEPAPGSPAAVLAAMDRMPSIPAEAFQDLEKAIDQSKTPVNYRGVFDEDGE